MAKARKPKGTRKASTGVGRGSNIAKGVQGGQFTSPAPPGVRAREMETLAKVAKRAKVKAKEDKKVNARKRKRKERGVPDSPAASPASSATVDRAENSPEPVDPRTDAGRKYLLRRARKLEVELPSGRRRSAQVLNKLLERQIDVLPPELTDIAAAASVGQRVRDAVAEGTLHAEDKNALFTAAAKKGAARV